MPPAPFHRPVRFDPHKFQHYPGAQGAQDLALAAQASARALLARGRANEDPSVTKRLVHFTDEFGLQTLTDLWAQAPAVSTAGALWRIYALRAVIRKDPQLISLYYQRGLGSNYAAQVLAGVADPPSAQEICDTVDQILAGAYRGDFDLALDRFAAFSRVLALGQEETALGIRTGQQPLDWDPTGQANRRASSSPLASAEVQQEARGRARRLRTLSQRLVATAQDLEAAARKWRAGQLD